MAINTTDCDDCDGTGEIELLRSVVECGACEGTGEVPDDDDEIGVTFRVEKEQQEVAQQIGQVVAEHL